jgi:hypothetical protein
MIPLYPVVSFQEIEVKAKTQYFRHSSVVARYLHTTDYSRHLFIHSYFIQRFPSSIQVGTSRAAALFFVLANCICRFIIAQEGI